MRKILILLVSVLMLFQVVGCGGDDNGPVYSSEYLQNETHHWKTLISGEGERYIEYGAHVNEKGRCSVCSYYYDVSEYLEFAKYYEGGHLKGYQLIRFHGEDANAPVHIKIPSSYKGEGDSEALPVVKIYNWAFCVSGNSETYWNYNEDTETYGLPLNGNALNTRIESVVIPDTIHTIGGSAFSGSGLKEVVVPDSVTSNLQNVFGGCLQLEKAVIGNGVTNMGGYTFSSCSNLKDVKLGNRVSAFGSRVFYECKSLKRIALPKSLVYLPESDIHSDAVDKLVALNKHFSYATDIFLEITEEELEALTVPLYNRDTATGDRIPDGISRNPGFCEGWSAMANLHFVGEWHYDADGYPVLN